MAGIVKTLTQEEADKILAALETQYSCTSEPWRGKRNHLLALFMLDTGLRVGEVIQLRFSNLFFAGLLTTTLHIPPEIAKNKHERLIPISTRLREAIDHFYQMRFHWNPFTLDGFLFIGPDRKTPLSTRQVERIICAAAIRSIGRSIHPHILRHTFGTRLMRVTNIRVVQQLLGHKNLSSTQIYTHPNGDDLKSAIENL